MRRYRIAILALITSTLAACATEPTTWTLGKEVTPPPGCIELRARTGDPKAC